MNDDISLSLRTAIGRADLKSVKKVVDQYGLSHFEYWRNGYVFLCDAIIWGELKIAKYLLHKGAEVNADTDYDWTPLLLAVENESVELVTLLLERNALVNARNDENKTALHIAVERGYTDIVGVLLDNNADFKPLLLAKRGMREKVVRLFVQSAFSASQLKDMIRRLEVLKHALDDSRFLQDMVDQFIIQIGAFNNDRRKFVDDLKNRELIHSRDYKNDSRIFAAIGMYYITIIDHLRVRDVRTSIERYWPFPLHTAVEMRLTEVVRVLLNAGFNANVKDDRGKTALHYDESYPKYFDCVNDLELLKILEMLLDNGASIEEVPGILHAAVKGSQTEVIRLLLSYGVNVNGKDERRKTAALHYALPTDKTFCLWLESESSFSKEIKYLATLQLLIESGADIKDTPHLLHSAVYRRWFRSCQVLIEKGADVNALDSNQMTPLHVIANWPWLSYIHEDVFPSFERRNIDIAELLLHNGADLGIKGPNGLTAFDCAVRHKKMTETALLFINSGMDVHSRDENGFTLLHLACHKEWDCEVVKILCEKGVDVNARLENGWTPLHFATTKTDKRVAIIEILLEFGADINARGSRGETPLHCANLKAKAMLKILLDRGSDINASTRSGATPFDTLIEAFGKRWTPEDLGSYLDGFKFADDLKNGGNDARLQRRSCRIRLSDGCDKGLKILKKHIIKLEVAELEANERIYTLLQRHFPESLRVSPYSMDSCREPLDDFRKQCQEELQRMKDVKLNSHFSLYDIFAKRRNPAYARNKSLMKCIERYFKCCDSFPLYKSLLLNCLKKSKERIKLIE